MTDVVPESPVSVARAPRITSRSLRANVLVLAPGREPRTLTGIEAAVWHALQTPCNLGQLSCRVPQRLNGAEPLAGIVRAMAGCGLLTTTTITTH